MTPAQTLIPHLFVHDGSAALDFYVRVFGGTQRYELREPSGRLAHAEIELSGNLLMLAEEYPELKGFGPRKLGGTPCSFALYVDDVDAVVARACAAGAELERPIANEFYGDRVGWLRDPFGHRWSIHTRREELSSDEIRARFEKLISAGP
ncbi:MAG TPA: VOC family protein [Polyangiales bacterium]|nr:VOC family protein [Polyangiales bacterium]